jgi:hypothetical protein
MPYDDDEKLLTFTDTSDFEYADKLSMGPPGTEEACQL